VADAGDEAADDVRQARLIATAKQVIANLDTATYDNQVHRFEVSPQLARGVLEAASEIARLRGWQQTATEYASEIASLRSRVEIAERSRDLYERDKYASLALQIDANRRTEASLERAEATIAAFMAGKTGLDDLDWQFAREATARHAARVSAEGRG
jgi:hypothetical protein